MGPARYVGRRDRSGGGGGLGRVLRDFGGFGCGRADGGLADWAFRRHRRDGVSLESLVDRVFRKGDGSVGGLADRGFGTVTRAVEVSQIRVWKGWRVLCDCRGVGGDLAYSSFGRCGVPAVLLPV